MPQQLLQEAIQQAELCTPAVQAAVFVHAARVLAKFDQGAAETLLERGIVLAQSLPSEERSVLLEEFAAVAAGVNPSRAIDLFSELEKPPFSSDRILFAMLAHDHIEEAAKYLTSPVFADAFPYRALTNTMADCRNDRDLQRSMLRAGMNAFRNSQQGSEGWSEHAFIDVFNLYWTLLPAEEARSFVHHFVQKALEQPDQKCSSRYSGLEHEVRFTSTRQELLWRIRGPLRRLDPEFAESLLKAHPELAKAAEDLPHGLHDSTHAPGYELSGKERAAQQRNEWDFVNHCWIPVDQWMMTCWEDGFLQAMALLDVDIEPRNPNLHPLEVWPSTQEFRMLMYKAGCYEDRDALERLQRVPNADVRLLARIELIAGMVGLPPFGGSSRSPRPVEDSPGMQAAKASTAFASLNLATLPMRWEGRSSARKVHTDFAEWDPQHRRWAPALRQEASSFRQDGRLEQTHGTLLDIRCEYDHDDRLYAIELIEEEQPKRFVCTYDENQHLIRVEETVTLAEETPDNILSIGGWSFSSSSGFQYSATPAGFRIEDATGIEIEYDGAGRRAAFAYARNGDPLCRVERQWNSEGRLLREIQTPYFPEADFEVPSAHLNFEYDSRGRCIRLENEIAEDYRYESTFLYDDNDTVVEANSREHRQRFEYTYDSHGNWTERVTRAWNEDKSEYVEVCIERRRIEYF